MNALAINGYDSDLENGLGMLRAQFNSNVLNARMQFALTFFDTIRFGFVEPNANVSRCACQCDITMVTTLSHTQRTKTLLIPL